MWVLGSREDIIQSPGLCQGYCFHTFIFKIDFYFLHPVCHQFQFVPTAFHNNMGLLKLSPVMLFFPVCWTHSLHCTSFTKTHRNLTSQTKVVPLGFKTAAALMNGSVKCVMFGPPCIQVVVIITPIINPLTSQHGRWPQIRLSALVSLTSGPDAFPVGS